jgi:hypothetical protein
MSSMEADRSRVVAGASELAVTVRAVRCFSSSADVCLGSKADIRLIRPQSPQKFGRAVARATCHAGGRGFESRHSRNYSNYLGCETLGSPRAMLLQVSTGMAPERVQRPHGSGSPTSALAGQQGS